MREAQRKIIARDKLHAQLVQEKERGRRIVFANAALMDCTLACAVSGSRAARG